MNGRQTSETALRIAAAAATLFRAQGYVATTMQAIAREAGVAVQTIYNTAGSKAAVLNLALDHTVAGGEFPRPVSEFMADRVAAAENAAAVVDVLVEWFTDLHPRSADIFGLIRQAAAVDPEVADLERLREKRRLDNYHLAADALAARGDLPLGREGTAAAIWSIGHPNVYRSLVIDGDWTVEMYRDWLAATLAATVIPTSD